MWAEELHIEFPMISDFQREMIERYGAGRKPVPFYGVLAGYHAFVVDSSRTLRFVHYQGENERPAPVEQVLDAVKSL